MKLTKTLLFLMTATLALSSCNSVPKKTGTTVSLKDAYAKDFYIGTALDTNQII